MKFIALLVISAVLASAASAAPANVTVTGSGRVQQSSDTVVVSKHNWQNISGVFIDQASIFR